MVISLDDEIAALEAQYENTKGPGAIEKKKELQTKINKLKEQNKQNNDEAANREVTPVAVVVNNSIPPYKKVTIEQVQAAEKAGKLCGFSASTMTASIKE